VKRIDPVCREQDLMAELVKTAANELGSITVVFGY
jgi:hypothetical protein